MSAPLSPLIFVRYRYAWSLNAFDLFSFSFAAMNASSLSTFFWRSSCFKNFLWRTRMLFGSTIAREREMSVRKVKSSDKQSPWWSTSIEHQQLWIKSWKLNQAINARIARILKLQKKLKKSTMNPLHNASSILCSLITSQQARDHATTSTDGNLPFFLDCLGRSLAEGFHPRGTLGSTRLLKGSRPVLSGRFYWPNSLGRLQSMTPL